MLNVLQVRVDEGSNPPTGPHLKSQILSWVSDLPDSEGMETNFEFDFYDNLMTEAIVTSKSEWECRQLRSLAVEVCPSAPLAQALGGSSKAKYYNSSAS